MGCGASKVQETNLTSGVTHAVRSKSVELSKIRRNMQTMEAIQKDDIFLIKQRLKEISPYDDIGIKGEHHTSLHEAAYNNSYNAMEIYGLWLKENHPNKINTYLMQENSQKQSCIEACVLNNSAETLYILLSQGLIVPDQKLNNEQSLVEYCKKHSPLCHLIIRRFEKRGEIEENKEILEYLQAKADLILEQPKLEPKNSELFINENTVLAKEINKKLSKTISRVSIYNSSKNILRILKLIDATYNNTVNGEKKTSDADLDPSVYGMVKNTELFGLLSDYIQAGSKIHEDIQFKAELSSITNNSNHKHYDTFVRAEWKRPHEFLSADYQNIKVFDTIDPNDISQGILGVCYLLSSLSAMAEFPSRLEKIFLNKNANRYGAYGLRLYIRGIPTDVLIDDKMPCNSESNLALFSKPKGNELWVMLAEKVWAKIYKSYTACENGFMDEALEYLTGAPSLQHVMKDDETDDDIWHNLLHSDQQNYIICAATKSGVTKDMGLIANHAYSVISAHEIGNKRILKLRNPWGNFEWTGDYSDNSKLWTPQLKAKLQYVNADDGVFFMTLKDFRKTFEYYSINLYHDGWEYSFITEEIDRNHAQYYKFSIDHPCIAYFRLHHDDARMMGVDDLDNYKYPSSDIIIARVEADGSYKTVFNSAEELHHGSMFGARSIFPTKDLESNLDRKGEYIVRVKVRGLENVKTPYTLSVYAPIKIDLEKAKNKKDFMSKVLLNEGKSKELFNMNNDCKLSNDYFLHTLFVYFQNDSPSQTWDVVINFTELENLRIAKAYTVDKTGNTIHMTIPPGKNAIAYLKEIDITQGAKFGWTFSSKLI